MPHHHESVKTYPAPKVSFFSRVTETTPERDESIQDVLEAIQTGVYREPVEQLRATLERDPDAYKIKKKELPAVTFGGTFRRRNKEGVIEPSGLVVADLDHLNGNAEKIRGLIRKDPSTAFAFISPSGDGLKVAYRFTEIPDDEAFKRAFSAVRARLLTLDSICPESFDESGKDICRLTFLSDDPAAYYNPEAVALKIPPAEPVKTPTPAPAPVTAAGNRQAQVALRNAIAEIQAAPEGQKHVTRRRWAFTIGGHVAGGSLHPSVLDDLVSAALSNTTDPRGAEKTIRDCFADGSKKPFTDATGDEDHLFAARKRTTDLSNARRMAATEGENARFCQNWKAWLVWDGKRWVRDETGEINRAAYRVVDATVHEIGQAIERLSQDAPKRVKDGLRAAARSIESRQKIQNMIDLCQTQPGIPISPADLDRDTMLLNVQNGVLDLRSCELRPHDRSLMQSKISPVEYDPNAECPTFDAFLDRIIPSEGVRLYLQRAVGYSLTGETRDQSFLALYGTGANGKTTLLECIRDILGAYAVSTPFDTFLEKDRRGNAPSNDLADLKGARFVSAVEPDAGARISESAIKAVTGGDMITARRLYENSESFKPQFTLWLAMNHRPRIRSQDYGIWRRVHLVPFSVQIPKSEQDESLPEKLRKELPGILRWAVDGCMAWQRQGLAPPPEVMAATKDYREREDRLAEFISERCETGPDKSVDQPSLWGEYVRFCGERQEEGVKKRTFFDMVEERGFERGKSGGARIFRGIALRPSGGNNPGRDKSFVPENQFVPQFVPEQDTDIIDNPQERDKRDKFCGKSVEYEKEDKKPPREAPPRTDFLESQKSSGNFVPFVPSGQDLDEKQSVNRGTNRKKFVPEGQTDQFEGQMVCETCRAFGADTKGRPTCFAKLIFDCKPDRGRPTHRNQAACARWTPPEGGGR